MRFFALNDAFRRWLDEQQDYPVEQRQHFLEVLEHIEPGDGLRALFPQHYRAHIAQEHPGQLSVFDACVGPIPERPADFAPLRQALCATMLTAMLTQSSGDIEADITALSDITAARTLRYGPAHSLKVISDGDLLDFFRNIQALLPTLYTRGSIEIVPETPSDVLRFVVSDLSGVGIIHLVWRGTARHMSAVPHVIRTGEIGPESFFFQVERDPSA